MFTLVNAVLLRGLPLDNADRIMWIDSRDQRGRGVGVSFQDYEDWRAASRTFGGMTLVQNGTMIISGDEPLPESYPGGFISANAFDVIGVKAQLGRGFVPDDDKEGAPPVALISGGIWKTRYASDPAIIGKAVRVNTIPATIVGVMPDGFKWPFQSEVWMPMSQRSPVFRLPRQGRSFMAYGRLADGATLEQARSEMKNIAAQLSNQYQDSNKDLTAQVTPFLDFVIGPQIKTMFWALMGAVAFVLLIACSNVANLLLARAADRSREVAVRVALGASRWRIVRQLLVESVLLAVISGIVGAGPRIPGDSMVRRRVPERRPAVLDDVQHGCPRVRLLRDRLHRHRHPLRPGARAAHFEDERERDHEGGRPVGFRRACVLGAGPPPSSSPS